MISPEAASLREPIAYALLKTPIGLLKISGTPKGLQSLTVLDSVELETTEIPDFLYPAVHQLKGYFSGALKTFNLDLDLIGTEFQKRVWTYLQQIPFGKTWSYLELAIQMGDANAVRAVAAANGKNPLWIVIPCHRVIGSDGSLTGYAGGLWRKRWLLEHEYPDKQQTLF